MSLRFRVGFVNTLGKLLIIVFLFATPPTQVFTCYQYRDSVDYLLRTKFISIPVLTLQVVRDNQIIDILKLQTQKILI